MWCAHGSDDEGPEVYARRASPPDNDVPVAVPFNVRIARTDDVALALTGSSVYSTGISFRLRAWSRRSEAHLNDVFWRNSPAADGLLVGVELAGGRWAVNGGDSSDRGIVFHPGGGGGGDRTCEQDCWLHPVPPPGPLAVVVRAPSLGIEETRTVVDATPLAAALAGVVELWPWTPAQPDVPDAAEPRWPVPADSWFARPRTRGEG